MKPAPTPEAATEPGSGKSKQANEEVQTQADENDAQDAAHACTTAYNAAFQCCTNPASCVTNYASMGGTGDTSINGTCDQNHALANQAADLNNSAATACIQRYTACSGACASADSNRANQCQDFSSLANHYASLAQSNYGAATQGLECQDNTKATAWGGGSNGAAGAHDDPCALDPGSPACAAAARAPTYASPGATAANLSGPTAYGDSYDTSGGGTTGGATTPNHKGSGVGNPPRVNTFANGGGASGLPGGRGPVAGIEGGNGAGGMFGAGAKPVTDIDEGLRSGGYSAPAEDGSGFPIEDTKRELAALERLRPPKAPWWDLRQYLPGSAAEAERLFAEAQRRQRLGINPAHIDLWSRISDKMNEKCRLGELLECR